MLFEKSEFQRRLKLVQGRMEKAGLDLLVVSEPANIYWLTGVADWSFYVPQMLVVSVAEAEPVWIGRQMDQPGAELDGWMDGDSYLFYPETYIQQPDIHPSDHMGELINARWPEAKRVGYEADAYYFSVRSFLHLQKALAPRELVDSELLVNWAKVIKSDAEIAYMRKAAAVVGASMQRAYEVIRPGVRQCDAAAEIVKAQIAPNSDLAGDVTALSPMILAGEKASTAHPIWDDRPFEDEQIVAVELGGAHRKYTCGLARTIYLGKNPPAALADTMKAVQEGLEAVLGTLKAGATGHDAHHAWNSILNQYGLEKASRIGYSIGAALPPDWGEHSISLRPGEHEPIPENACIHVMLGMWMDGWGMELSETVRIKAGGVECLTNFNRDVFQV